MDAADLPDDIATLKALLIEAQAARLHAEAREKSAEALVLHMRLKILRLRRAQFGQKSERGARLIEQMELSLEDIEGDIAEDGARAEVKAGADDAASEVAAHTRRQPKRGPLPEHLPRERVVIAAPTSCPCCDCEKLSKLGEDITETLEVVPRQFFVKQTVRERWSCRACETITQPPAPFHVIARGRAGPSLLAMILAGKYNQHLPLHRQADAFAHEGAPIEVSTMADWVGASAAALEPLTQLIRDHVFAAERLHADATTVPVLEKGKTRVGRLWVYARDDRPFGGDAPPAAAYFYTPDRGGEHPRHHLEAWSGFLQADAYSGFAALYGEGRNASAITEVACRVGGDVTSPAPHRPGRADFPHPVLNVEGSLWRRVLVDDRHRRQRASGEHGVETRPPHFVAAPSINPALPDSFQMMGEPAQSFAIAGDTVVGAVAPDHARQMRVLLWQRHVQVNSAPVRHRFQRADSCGPRARADRRRQLFVRLGVAISRKSGCRLTVGIN